MDKLAEKIKMVCDANAHFIHAMNESDLINFLWEHDCIRDRVINKTELRNKVKSMSLIKDL